MYDNDHLNLDLNSVASLTENKEAKTSVFNFLHLSQHDIWLYAISITGLIILAFVFLFMMKRNKSA